MMLFWLPLIACAPRVEPWDAPKPPDLIEMAEKFSDPQGSLDDDNISDLTDWLMGDGGVAVLGSVMVFQTVFPSIFSELESGMSDEDEEEAENENSLLDGDGWFRLTLPCGGADIEQAHMEVSSLFSSEGLDPRIWGAAENCKWAEDELDLNAQIGFLVPFVSPAIDQTIWEGEDGKWFSFDGKMNIFDYEVNDAFQVMLDSENQMKILWENDKSRFIIQAPVIDPESLELNLENLAELSALNIKIATGDGQWTCILANGNCSNSSGQVLDW